MKDYIRKEYDDGKDIFGYPQKYKNIELHPILIKDTKYRNLFYKLLCRPKNYIPDKIILKISYLKFIIYVLQGAFNPEGNELLDEILDFMGYITKKEVSINYKNIEGEGLLSISLQIQIGDDKFSEFDFEDMREIILEQNGLSIDYIESFDPSLEEYLAFNNRKNESIDFLDEIFTFCAIMRLGIKEVEQYTIFQFKNSMEKVMVLEEYHLYKPLIASGQVELKSGEVKHYLYHSVKAGRYDSIMIKREDFEQNSEIMKLPQ